MRAEEGILKRLKNLRRSGTVLVDAWRQGAIEESDIDLVRDVKGVVIDRDRAIQRGMLSGEEYDEFKQTVKDFLVKTMTVCMLRRQVENKLIRNARRIKKEDGIKLDSVRETVVKKDAAEASDTLVYIAMYEAFNDFLKEEVEGADVRVRFDERHAIVAKALRKAHGRKAYERITSGQLDEEADTDE